ncbi:hypothetical protein E2C01_081696 [Portunus trituberculatus]|uniref:Uncharacterized protein n=1 Tax=Portunus trituberculatus TaxID=210409 RepID=A0A5B7IX89_PORTR|nr:hypothetical protein [Portunus trituberculatus]
MEHESEDHEQQGESFELNENRVLHSRDIWDYATWLETRFTLVDATHFKACDRDFDFQLRENLVGYALSKHINCKIQI